MPPKKEDREILGILEKDARATPRQIASETGLAEARVREAIRRLESQGVIRAYRGVIDWERAGAEQVYALVDVHVGLDRQRGYAAIAERIALFPEVQSVRLVSGDYDLSIVVRGPTMKEVASFIAEKIATLEQVKGTVTHFELRLFKEHGEPFFEREKRKRLPVSA